MWSNVEETIGDGASGLAPGVQPTLVFAGASTRGAEGVPLVLGSRSDVGGIFGRGPLADALEDCQKSMADVSIIAVRTPAEGLGSVKITAKTGGFLAIEGAPLCGGRCILKALNAFEAEIRLDGEKPVVRALDGRVLGFEEWGLTLTLPEGAAAGDYWVLEASAPSSSLEALREGIGRALELYTPEAAIVCQNSSAEDAAFWGAEAETYFSALHKPIQIILSTDLEEGGYEEAIAAKIAEFAKADARFVSVLCQPGKIKDGSFQLPRQPLGLLAATLTRAGVSQSIGATRWFAVSHFELPQNWSNAQSRALDEARFVTLRTYAGLNGLFWSNGRTLAGDGSDYRFIEVARTVHRAIRLARRACLGRIQAPGDGAGIREIVALIRSALTQMTASSPVEILGFELDVPENQDVVNRGLLVNISLFGVPIVRKIVLNFMYVYRAEG